MARSVCDDDLSDVSHRLRSIPRDLRHLYVWLRTRFDLSACLFLAIVKVFFVMETFEKVLANAADDDKVY